MSATDTPASKEVPAARPRLPALELLKKLAIWVLFLTVLYLARSFFFVAFMTFLFSFITLAFVGWAMKRLSPNRESPRLRRFLTLGFFLLVPLLLVGVGWLVAPRLLAQVQHLAGWMSQVSPETEVSRLLAGFVGPSEFRAHYGAPGDPRYQKGLEEFRKTGVLHARAYNEFPQLEAWVEGGFSKQFADEEQGRIRIRLARAGTSSKEFEQWFLRDKVPELQEEARRQMLEKGRPSVPVAPLVRAAASASPEQLLDRVRGEPAVLGTLRQEWIKDTLEHDLPAARQSPDYLEQFRAHYEKQRERSPQTIPYTFEQYQELRKARPQGQVAFGKALEKMMPSSDGESDARLRQDFEAAKEHDLFQEWWRTSTVARVVRHHVETGAGGDGAGQLDQLFSSLVNIPMDLGTALLLSFFICIDFPQLRRGIRGLRETWLKDVYDEIAPALTTLAHLVGRALAAQGMIAFCNAVMMFFGLTLIGVEHEVLLSVATFVLCLVPTLGAVLAWVLIAVCALVQPGGGVVLALKATGAVLFVMLMEIFVFSPRILGRAMDLHPVLIMALLPLAQFFFGVWGLILATPVAVYVIYVIIFRRDLLGVEAPQEAAGRGPPGPGPDGPTASPPGPKTQDMTLHQPDTHTAKGPSGSSPILPK